MKTYQFLMNDYSIGGSAAFREKMDIIILLLNTIKYLNSYTLGELETVSNANIQLVIHVDKMSRIFLCEEEKIHTFQFPFVIFEDNDRLKVFYKDQELNSKITSIIFTIFSNKNLITGTIESLVDLYFDTMNDYDSSDKFHNELCWDLVLYLLTFEPGYLRYDYDVERQNGNKHPLNHIDFYYSNKNTFKIGLNEKFDNKALINLLDINQDCKFLK